MTIALFALAALLILLGLAGVVLPALPGVPLMFAGMLLAAWADGFRHVGALTLTVLGLLAVLALLVDFAAGALGAKRVGASGLALLGATLGTVVGLFFGIPGLLLGPFVGALLGELLAGGSVLRAANVGAGTWLGLLLGTLVKLALSFAMLGVFALALML
ncbi:hypothetical protein MBSD_n1520 [Mizugakiibacter sediminis]|uniref:DUF456 domain-containing protein n=1 Tax=Mizugakiibacter sediminis TaxID=1475481 RepID=A0A0K8QP82_9GAMM|nr:DUF456 domain-containing protein [Mizugakiibacter sediminis]GAP66217.1 hypothetical protein MBSD_n1520 [Mizugakiibacter sediminis]